MAYNKTNWQDTLRDAQGNVIQKGTPLNAQALGKIEEGIVQTEQKIDTEISKVTKQLAQNVQHLQIAIESFPIIAPETNDSARIQRAINYCESNGIGVLKAEGAYTLGATLNLPSNLVILGTSPIRTKFYLLEGITAFEANAKRNIVIKDLAFDGIGRVGTRVFYSRGESSTIQFDNVWIDSVERGIETEYTYFMNLKNVRTMGTRVPFLFRNATNVVNMENCSGVIPATDSNILYSGYAVTAFNGSCLSIKGCSFEGRGGRVLAYTWSGLSLDAVYFENQSGVQAVSWITLGNGLGNKVKGASIKGCNFLGGFRYGISILSVEGLEVSGNTFDTDEAGIQYYRHDNTPKTGVNIGQNSFKVGISRIVYAGDFADSPNSNELQQQLMPTAYKPQNTPYGSHLDNGDVAIFNKGNGVLALRSKKNDGTGSVDNIFTGIDGASTIFAGQKEVVVNHSLGKTPIRVLLTAESNEDVGSVKVKLNSRGNSQFTIILDRAPTVNTTVYWIIK